MKVMVLGSNPVSPHFSCVTQTCGLTTLGLTFSIGKTERGWMHLLTDSQVCSLSWPNKGIVLKVSI